MGAGKQRLTVSMRTTKHHLIEVELTLSSILPREVHVTLVQADSPASAPDALDELSDGFSATDSSPASPLRTDTSSSSPPPLRTAVLPFEDTRHRNRIVPIVPSPP